MNKNFKHTKTLKLLIFSLVISSVTLFFSYAIPEKTEAAGTATCTAINTLTNSTYQITAPGANGPCYGVYTCGAGVGSGINEIAAGQYSTCKNPVTGATMPAGYSCKNGLSVDGIGGISSRWLPSTMIPCAQQDHPPKPDPRGGGPIILTWRGAVIDRNGCYAVLDYTSAISNGGFASVAGMACGATENQPRCFLDCFNRSGTPVTTTTGSQTSTGAGSSSTDCLIPGASIRKNNPILFAPVRCVKLTGNTIEGWVYNPDTANAPLKIRVYGKKSGASEQTFIREYTANTASADLDNSPALKQIEGGVNHAFSIPVPSGYSTGDTILVYAVNSVDPDGWNILIKEINL